MAYTQDDLTKVQKAIASGVLSIRYADGRSVTHHSIKELMEVETKIKKELNTGKPRPRMFVARTSKGL